MTFDLNSHLIEFVGVWQVPMVMWQDLNGGRCSMGDACSNPPDSDGVVKMIMKNFERHYTTNRYLASSMISTWFLVENEFLLNVFFSLSELHSDCSTMLPGSHNHITKKVSSSSWTQSMP